MSDQLTAQCCLGFICIGWPAVWAWAAWNIRGHGLRGWARLIVTRAKNFGPSEE